ncbi:MAG: serine dehydratase subunit alpha family protein [Bacillota bacterium]|jgi:L-cysteine desulfidase|uniref:L-cysteine desulfidase family protein n=1 Tax=Bacillaceae TaxID=186817 RepID=UPI0013D6A9E2|nr:MULTISPECIES: L-serine ammonia-lyase, iron-sulfur-dependent, subunit alpha [Bacillaceae]MCC3645925.1 serine dehydratase subunit alpha family protein [Cytobacillus oceanisediminis]MCS0652519.1 L-serine ammonia-lyase, iron-sulfur-dependent, subunit alpha [Cytobacillus firmus]MCU1804285.1 L-serine ammonia-lyase, iron-sulfur-dependent, subunit alpha [Cytobacillus firmus]
MEKHKILRILEKELVVALGCTEPVAIALAAATAKSHAKGEIKELCLKASGNIIKNAKSVGIPGMSSYGLDFAAAIGAVAGDPARKLEVLEGVGSEDELLALKLIEEGKVTSLQAETPKRLYIETVLKTDIHTSRVVISDNHSNITLIEVDGEVIYQGGCENIGIQSEEDELIALTIDEIYEWVLSAEISSLSLVKKSIELNRIIGMEGLSGEYGLKVGKTIKRNVEMGILSDDIATAAMSLAAAGSDARMAGSTLPVMANTGSGNQGIAVTLPVVAAAERLKVTNEKMIRAVALSHLITIHIKSKFGRLSALCGVTAAGMGASAAIVYLLDGQLHQIKAAIQNTIGNVSGMICDGAKAGCAMKVSTCSNVAVQSALLALNDQEIKSTDGFIHDDVEKSIESFCKLGNEGTRHTDELILKLMMEK